jgi:uncharacterized membrane protein YeiH
MSFLAISGTFSVSNVAEIIAIGVFALTGALVALRRNLDILGFVLLATVTGVGGGTLRDLLLGRPVFWVYQPRDLLICLAVALIGYSVARLKPALVAGLEGRVLLYADAMGLALFSAAGAVISLESGASPLVAVAFGAMTASFGGILRDVLAGEDTMVLRQDIYITAAAFGAGLVVAAKLLGLSQNSSVLTGIIGGFALRAAAISFGWTLPRVRRS